MHPQVDDYLATAEKWEAELRALREILLDSKLTEAWKWRAPCYTFQGKNIAILGAFHDCCSLAFFKGALLRDPDGLLQKPGENTQASRVLRWTQITTITAMASRIKAWIREAISLEEAGLKCVFEPTTEEAWPIELRQSMEKNADFEAAFRALTPGRQRGYVLYFSAPKQSASRSSRIEKFMPRIFSGYGIHNCTCGRSKKLPTCDGSHREISE